MEPVTPSIDTPEVTDVTKANDKAPATDIKTEKLTDAPVTDEKPADAPAADAPADADPVAPTEDAPQNPEEFIDTKHRERPPLSGVTAEFFRPPLI